MKKQFLIIAIATLFVSQVSAADATVTDANKGLHLPGHHSHSKPTTPEVKPQGGKVDANVTPQTSGVANSTLTTWLAAKKDFVLRNKLAFGLGAATVVVAYVAVKKCSWLRELLGLQTPKKEQKAKRTALR